MNELDIHSLRVFLEAAKTLNFTEAGRTLSLSQPAVSMQIRSLEDYLQLMLFERSPQGMRLTRAGEELMLRAQQIVDLVIHTEDSLRAHVSQVTGSLVIGCSATAGKYVLPHVVAQFKRLYPDVHVSIPVVPLRTMLENIISGAYDLGVTSMHMPDLDVTHSDFFTDHLTLITSASHPWARRGVINAEELIGEPLICREAESACRKTVSAGLASQGVDMADLQVVMEVGSAEALAMAVEYGLGVSFVSVLAAVPRVALGRLAMIQIEGVDLHSPVELMSCRTRPASPAQAKFIEFVMQPRIRTSIQLLAEGRSL